MQDNYEGCSSLVNHVILKMYNCILKASFFIIGVLDISLKKQ